MAESHVEKIVCIDCGKAFESNEMIQSTEKRGLFRRMTVVHRCQRCHDDKGLWIVYLIFWLIVAFVSLRYTVG